MKGIAMRRYFTHGDTQAYQPQRLQNILCVYKFCTKTCNWMVVGAKMHFLQGTKALLKVPQVRKHTDRLGISRGDINMEGCKEREALVRFQFQH